MESRVPARDQSGTGARIRLWTGLIKTAVGLGLLAALLFWGRIDLKALSVLAGAPSAIVICVALLLLAIPLAALRWGILLHAFGLSIPFTHLLHFFSIGLLANL